MKRFILRYEKDRGSLVVRTESELEMLLKRYGFRIVNHRISELSKYSASDWDYQDEGGDYVEPTYKTYYYDVEYDEESVSSGDVEEFLHFVKTLYGRFVTYMPEN